MNQLILDKVYKLIDLHRSGELGGEIMPEDENPGLDITSLENYIYFTLPMALNYQRNSYTLWAAANKTYHDSDTADVFDPKAVVKMPNDQLQQKLLKYKVVLQPNKHIYIWKTISNTIVRDFDGDIRNLFIRLDYDVKKIKDYVLAHKKDFPYLGGPKLLNYWVYVLEQYAGAKFKNRDCISVAADTHVIRGTARLGLITEIESMNPNIREEVGKRWHELLLNTDLISIDVHTPLWLWSRGGFKQEL